MDSHPMTKLSEAVKRARASMRGNLIAEVHVGDLSRILRALEERTAALEKAKAALLSGDPDGLTWDDVTIYRLDGGKVGVALNAARAALKED